MSCVYRVGKLNKPSAQLNWVLLMEQLRLFVEGFSREQVKEDPVCCELPLAIGVCVIYKIL